MSRFLRTLATGAAISLNSCGGGDGGQTAWLISSPLPVPARMY
jgi:hypothetical protein